MSMEQAISKAVQRAALTSERWIVVCRQDHPHVQGDYFYAIRWDDKHAWTPGESLILYV